MNNQNTFQPILINFNIPNHLKYKLDRVSKLKGITRTSILNGLIEDYVRKETDLIEKDGRIYEMMSKLENTMERTILRSNSFSHTRVSPLKQQSWENSYIDDTHDNLLPFLYEDGR